LAALALLLKLFMQQHPELQPRQRRQPPMLPNNVAIYRPLSPQEHPFEFPRCCGKRHQT